MTKRKMFAVVMTPVVLAGFAGGCDEKPAAPADAPQGAAQAEGSGSLPASLRLAGAPAGAQEVTAAKGTVRDGDKVVVRGVVAGRVDPIAENRAILTLLDGGIKTCDTNVEGCKTPWDACCEPAEVLAKNSLTVQVVDATGRPVRASLAGPGGVAGVKPMARVVVSGTAKVAADGVVVVNADGIFVEP